MAYDMSDEMEAKLLVVHVFDYPTFLDDISLKRGAGFPDAVKKYNYKIKANCYKKKKF